MKDRTEDVRADGFTDHLLVCTNDRDSEYACCAEAHGAAVFETVTDWLRERGVFWSQVHVAETSCLGLCSAEGTAIAIHPRNRWYSDITPEDVPELLAAEFGPEATRLGVQPDSQRDDAPLMERE
jgi:(2Fe-2S) ferredoxin